MRVINADHPSLEDQQSPDKGIGLRRQKQQKRHKYQGNTEAAPDAENITVEFVPLINQSVKRREETIKKPVNDP